MKLLYMILLMLGPASEKARGMEKFVCWVLRLRILKLRGIVCGRYSITKAFCIGFVMTFFSVFDVPVFWPILLFYWVVLFSLTMRRQISHMIKYRYVPFTFGKQVKCCFLVLVVTDVVCVYFEVLSSINLYIIQLVN